MNVEGGVDPNDILGAEIIEIGLDETMDPAMALELATGGGMQEEDRSSEIHAIIQTGLEEAIQFYEEHLEPDQVKATDYYYGRPFGDEQTGRSKVVSTDVRDAVKSQLASLLRIFFSTEHTVEFRPKGPEDEEVALQQTEYVRHVVTEDNEGFLTFYSAFKDALVRRLGIIKWWRDEVVRTSSTRYTGMSEIQIQFLTEDPAVEIEVLGETGFDQETGQPLFDVMVTHTESEGVDRIAAVPPEEFIYTPNARDIDSAPLVAHVREVPVSELMSMGIDPDIIDNAVGKTRALSSENLDIARQFHGTETGFDSEEKDYSQRPVLFAEVYALVDVDGSGISERRMFHCVGPDFQVVNGLGYPCDDVPFALFCPDPEPHTIVGLSTYDLLKDVQRVKSQVLRSTLNSLALSVEPQLEVVAGEVNMQDVLNPEVSGIIRVRKPGMLREIKHGFVGGDTLPVLSYYDEIKENRTGISKAAAGLDADSLQSATKAAVAATLTGAQQHIEMIARVFSETGMKRLFLGLLRQIVKHQDRTRVVRLRGQYIEVDPRHWDANRDVTINVALGQGAPEDRIMALTGILGLQRELMQAGSPLVTNVELRKTLAKAAELAGFRNSDEFFRPWGPEEEMQAQEAAASQPPPPDPNQMLVQIEQMRVQVEQMKAETTFELERQKMILQDDRERDKVARQSVLKEYELELKYRNEINDAQIQSAVEQDRMAMDQTLPPDMG